MKISTALSEQRNAPRDLYELRDLIRAGTDPTPLLAMQDPHCSRILAIARWESRSCCRMRIPVSALPVVAHTLSVTMDELFGQAAPRARTKRGPAPQWEQQIEQIAKLPRARQKFVSEMPQTVLQRPER